MVNSILERIIIDNDCEEKIMTVKFAAKTKEGYETIKTVVEEATSGRVGVSLTNINTDDECSISIHMELNRVCTDQPLFIGFDEKLIMLNVENHMEVKMLRFSANRPMNGNGKWFYNGAAAGIFSANEGYEFYYTYKDPHVNEIIDRTHEICKLDFPDPIEAVDLWISENIYCDISPIEILEA